MSNAEQELTDYQRGVLEGLRAFAWWRDGVQMVGTCGTTLKQAEAEFLNEGVPPTDLHEPDLLEACHAACDCIMGDRLDDHNIMAALRAAITGSFYKKTEKVE